MTASDTVVSHAWPWLVGHRQTIIRLIATPVALWATWWLTGLPLPPLVELGVVGYGLTQVVLVVLARQSHRVVLLNGLSLAADAALAVLLLLQASQIGDAIYPLYLLVALRALTVYSQLPAATIVPFLLGPALLFTQSSLRQGSPLAAGGQGAQWGLLLGSLGFGAAAILSAAAGQRSNRALQRQLADAKVAAEQRVAQLERATADLRARVREQHALEEGLRVITSTLSLDEVLHQIVESTTQMLGMARVQGTALSLVAGEGFTHQLLEFHVHSGHAWADLLASRVTEQQVPLIIADVERDAELANVVPPGMRAVLSVPLFAGAGAPRGALTVVSATPAAFSSSDARHLIAFAIQAGIALGNAEMHSQLRRQQHLLEAVVRDMSDGLVVIDSNDQIVLSNPLGRELLHTPTATVGEQLLSLTHRTRNGDQPTLTNEIQLDSEDERNYQAFASQVRQQGDGAPLTAIVLHDVTAHKREQRHRTEFISMVAHELRNPLNSLNGFVKIVLQGRAGPLTALQEEFLQIADTQVEQLKGRISELLEFNRLDAGRLALRPNWHDPATLVAATLSQLQLQVEQAGLTLLNQISRGLPPCYCDSERIGQVLTNLIENAIKATGQGGTIILSATLQANELWLHVADTGVGIPPEEQGNIFKPFYRAHNHSSSQGNHMGLGLAICQQIIEGHHGRIWVESEAGQGSRFSFALPLVSREAAA